MFCCCSHRKLYDFYLEISAVISKDHRHTNQLHHWQKWAYKIYFLQNIWTALLIEFSKYSSLKSWFCDLHAKTPQGFNDNIIVIIFASLLLPQPRLFQTVMSWLTTWLIATFWMFLVYYPWRRWLIHDGESDIQCGCRTCMWQYCEYVMVQWHLITLKNDEAVLYWILILSWIIFRWHLMGRRQNMQNSCPNDRTKYAQNLMVHLSDVIVVQYNFDWYTFSVCIPT